MMKAIFAGGLALALAGAGLALAQQSAPPDAQQAPQQTAPRSRPSAEDMSAFVDARIAGLKAGLKLTAEQEKHWPAVETAIRDLAKQRSDRMKERAERRAARASGTEPPRPDMIGRLRRGADAMTTRAAALKRLADAGEPLYRSLDDGQKRRFGILLRMGGRDGMRGRWQRRADNAR